MKRKVHPEYLKDMKKYIKDLNVADYESSFEKTDQSVIEFVRKYYDKNLPVDVTAWIRVNEPDKDLIYGKCLSKQACFIRDKICSLLYPNYDKYIENLPMVISTHCSKSVKLPVYQINLKDYGIEMILRDNFYDWKISIKSEKPLEFDYMDIFNPDKLIDSSCCEGFPKDKVYGTYNENHSKFTIEFFSDYDLYTFMFLLKNYLGIQKA